MTTYFEIAERALVDMPIGSVIKITETRTLAQTARHYGISPQLLKGRLKRGWSPDRAVKRQ